MELMMEFPIFKTKMEGVTEKFDLTDVEGRRKYFTAKAGDEIKRLQEYMKDNTFIAYMMGKKSSGKGTYAKMLAEILGEDKIEHLSVGDIVRGIDKKLADPAQKEDFINFLKNNYRGFLSLDEIVESLENRSTTKLLPTEFVLAVVKGEIAKRDKKTLFIDGFPRELDQMSYSLFFTDLIDYRGDKDVFVLIDVPKTVIDERIKWRRICPVCQTSRNLKLLVTKEAGFDEKEGFYLLCDNPSCEGAKMVQKEGDEKGIEPIRERLEKDEMLVGKAAQLYGVPKVFLRNAIPVDRADQYVDGYEITPGFEMEHDTANNKVEIKELPWVVKNDEGIDSYSLMPPPVVVALIKQLVKVLEI